MMRKRQKRELEEANNVVAAAPEKQEPAVDSSKKLDLKKLAFALDEDDSPLC